MNAGPGVMRSMTHEPGIRKGGHSELVARDPGSIVEQGYLGSSNLVCKWTMKIVLSRQVDSKE